MKKWYTEFYAKHNITGETRTFTGPLIEAPSKSLAQHWCNENAGHLFVIDECVAVIDGKTGRETDFEITQNN